ncbi:DMT family transporter [Georgenia yuyongxinii]|uniref:DMT family transporter n=1 Tax=Georgenia yuyongxinii TaxID=2589797 RepID=A0A552WJI1_9MICO|nr:DMT family transporter [Georgenia yuyongxinii]TRW42886.1 DMT family transporter [Georgenia yuyongxinii]
MRADRGERVARAAFAAQSVLAGGNAVAVRFSNRELAPLWGAGLRFVLAAALLAAAMALLRLPLPRGRAQLGAVLYGLLNFGFSFALTYHGLVHVHAGLGQALLALVPLFTLLLAVLWRQERLRPAAVAGTVLALAGVLLLSREPLRHDVPVGSVLSMIGGAVCFAQALVVVRRFPRVHPVTMNAVGMGVAAVVLLAGSVVTGEQRVLPTRSDTWFALGYVVVVGSVVVFLLYVAILRYWAASRAAYTWVVVPFVTVVLSARLDDEPVTAWLVAGCLLILAGVYVGALRREPAAASSQPAR